MFIDASAIVAIVAPEEDGPALSARLDQTDTLRTSPISIYEAVLGLARKLDISVVDAGEAVDNFQTEIIPVTAEISRGAITAFERFGRGRHPARLNMGDCFAYACARSLDVPLLFKGDDFAQTDIPAA